MFNLTPQEKLIIIFIGLVALFGVTLEYYRKSQPQRAQKINSFIEKNIIKNNQFTNINTATKEELIKISGIGEKTAQAIIAYREAHSGFTSLDELESIKGINKSKLEKIKNYLTVE